MRTTLMTLALVFGYVVLLASVIMLMLIVSHLTLLDGVIDAWTR